MTNSLTRYPLAPDVEIPSWPEDLAQRESEWDFDLSEDSYVVTPRAAIFMPPPIRKRYVRRGFGYTAIMIVIVAVFWLCYVATP